MSGPYLLAIDQGTTSSRAVLFKDARIVGVAQRELKLHYPQNGWVEQNPEDIWRDTVDMCLQVLREHNVTAAEVASIGMTNQRETTVVWDRKTGQVLGNAIVWQDRRTAGKCTELAAAGHEPMLRRKTGLLFDSYFSGSKIAWILDNTSGARKKAEAGELAFGTIDCFLLWRLTEGRVHATDATNASRTMLYNIVAGEWDDELLALLRVPRTMMPEVCDSSYLYGHTKIFGGRIAIGGIAGDQQAALFGQACFNPGMIKSTYGTGCFALMNIGDTFRESRNRLLTTIAYRLNGKTTYAIEGSIFIAGAAIQWLRDGLKIVKNAAETENLAAQVSSTNGVYMVPAFTGLGAPYWDPDARGALLGLTRDTSVAHIVRAALEAQGYQTRDLMTAMMEDTGQKPAELRVDGGMVANNFVCQFLSDITGLSVARPQVIETTSLGAAYLAGLNAGIYGSVDDITRQWNCERRFVPDMNPDRCEYLYAGWNTAVGQVRNSK